MAVSSAQWLGGNQLHGALPGYGVYDITASERRSSGRPGSGRLGLPDFPTMQERTPSYRPGSIAAKAPYGVGASNISSTTPASVISQYNAQAYTSTDALSHSLGAARSSSVPRAAYRSPLQSGPGTTLQPTAPGGVAGGTAQRTPSITYSTTGQPRLISAAGCGGSILDARAGGVGGRGSPITSAAKLVPQRSTRTSGFTHTYTALAAQSSGGVLGSGSLGRTGAGSMQAQLAAQQRLLPATGESFRLPTQRTGSLTSQGAAAQRPSLITFNSNATSSHLQPQHSTGQLYMPGDSGSDARQPIRRPAGYPPAPTATQVQQEYYQQAPAQSQQQQQQQASMSATYAGTPAAPPAQVQYTDTTSMIQSQYSGYAQTTDQGRHTHQAAPPQQYQQQPQHQQQHPTVDTTSRYGHSNGYRDDAVLQGLAASAAGLTVAIPPSPTGPVLTAQPTPSTTSSITAFLRPNASYFDTDTAASSPSSRVMHHQTLASPRGYQQPPTTTSNYPQSTSGHSTRQSTPSNSGATAQQSNNTISQPTTYTAPVNSHYSISQQQLQYAQHQTPQHQQHQQQTSIYVQPQVQQQQPQPHQHESYTHMAPLPPQPPHQVTRQYSSDMDMGYGATTNGHQSGNIQRVASSDSEASSNAAQGYSSDMSSASMRTSGSANSTSMAVNSQHQAISARPRNRMSGGAAPMRQVQHAGSSVHVQSSLAAKLQGCTLSARLPAGSGCVGLQNLGNTCFMNSILQVLNAVPELVRWCHTDIAFKPKAVVSPSYVDLVQSMWRTSAKSVVSPSAFVRALSRMDSRWGDGSQQDAQEFLHALLESLQSECNLVVGKPQYRELSGKGSETQQADEADSYARSWHNSIVDDVFGGLMQSTLQCQVCRRQSYCFEPFMDLALPLPPAARGQNVSVQDCLQAFVELEQLDGSESYKCESCKQCCPHTKRLQVWRPPQALVLTLKRFAQRNTGTSIFSRFRSTAKNSAAVQLEVDHLDLTPYCNWAGLQAQGLHQPTYRLVSISHHSGSLEGGHYTASARSAADGQWYNFNDSSVRRESPPSGASSSAYVLVYELVQDG